MDHRTSTHRLSHRGVALVAVLWVVAALTIMVGGAIYGGRAETRAVTVDRQLARAAALADAVIAQTLQAWGRPGERRPTGAMRLQLAFDGVDMELNAYPASGLVDINSAPEPLLAAVFVHGAALAPDAAKALAQAVEAARQQTEFKAQGYRFAALEELLQVPGLSYDTYRAVVHMLTVGGGGGGRVNPLAAPLDVLTVLAEGDAAVAQQFAQARESSGAQAPAWSLNAPWTSTEVSNRYMFVVSVPQGDGIIVRVSRWVDLDAGRTEGLPWTVFHGREVVEAVRN
jgi:general secretion pathway protein K